MTTPPRRLFADREGESALSVSAFYGWLDCVKRLVETVGLNPKVAVNQAGDTPLSLECSRGDLEMIKALINKHVDPNKPVNKAGDTPLSLACANGHLDTVKYLVNQHHCDPKSKYWYILMVHQLLHHSVHSYMYRYSQQCW
ncbi:protein fem-1 homolog A-like [Halichondria panicea]|uniref:protein fem-1 homolog A-like n=1 Tax=Halichondria panicea TaxID=6063 RepID=UPI00312BB601